LKLYDWLRRQRNLCCINKIRKERLQLLQAVGFIFTPPKAKGPSTDFRASEPAIRLVNGFVSLPHLFAQYILGSIHTSLHIIFVISKGSKTKKKLTSNRDAELDIVWQSNYHELKKYFKENGNLEVKEVRFTVAPYLFLSAFLFYLTKLALSCSLIILSSLDG
jgi:hypothetical protein